jgi:choline kinase
LSHNAHDPASSPQPAPAQSVSMRAVLLAAGVGDRLRPFTDHHPKCLVEVGQRSLLAHHLDLLSQIPEISGIVIVVGYLEDQIRDAVAAWKRQTGNPFAVAFEVNPEFLKGSILSLHTAREHLVASDTVIMDADVLYPRELMERLVRAPHANCFLIDETCVPTGEEMMVCVSGERALHIARSREPSTQSGWDLTGEGVGFFRLDQHDSVRLVAIMDAMIADGLDRVEYEAALDRFMKERVAGYVPCGDLPWTEIDFPEDVAKAVDEVFPAILAAGLTL